jgi:SAM-dependent methyltransferase
MISFTCNICGKPNRVEKELLDREKPSCGSCGSSVRTRSLVHALAMELFGVGLALADFPRVKSLRGIGLSDADHYAERLAGKLDYRNTFYSREPRLDIANPPADEFGKYDFLISSEVFEHVAPPVAVAFQNAFRLLKPNGVLLVTVPYSLASATTEHFGGLQQFGLARVGDQVMLVNRSATGELEVFDNLTFHFGGEGPSLEMREFSEEGLRSALAAAGFSEVRFYTEDHPPFGMIRGGSWSLPVAARKAPFAFQAAAAQEMLTQWAALRKNFRELGGEFWVRLGYKLGMIDLRRYFTSRDNGFEPKSE